jgi:hypothetical protein
MKCSLVRRILAEKSCWTWRLDHATATSIIRCRFVNRQPTILRSLGCRYRVRLRRTSVQFALEAHVWRAVATRTTGWWRQSACRTARSPARRRSLPASRGIRHPDKSYLSRDTRRTWTDVEVRVALTELVQRRNAIAHNGDLRPTGGSESIKRGRVEKQHLVDLRDRSCNPRRHPGSV